MVQFTNILCSTDLSEPSQRALTHAAAVARLYDSTLTVLHVVPTFDAIPVRSSDMDGAVQMLYPPSREEVEGELRRFVEAAGAGSFNPTILVEAGDPSKTIVDRALAMPADLVVMGTHGRSGFERLMIGSVAEKVLRKAPCPVLTVPPHAASRPADVRIRNVLCPMDFSPAALQAFGFALDLARQASGTLTLVHVIEWLAEEEPRAHTPFNVPEYRQHLMEDAQQRVRALVADESWNGPPIQECVVLGRAHREIVHIASEAKTDLIVMGAQGRGGLGLALFGSTTQQVVRIAPCPVLTVRAAGSEHTS